ncbi:MAG: hypothetical protein AB7N76_09875 [Planctomycetota bacterium]
MAKRAGKRANKVVSGRGWELVPAPGRGGGGSSGRRTSEPPGDQRIKVRTVGRGGGKTVTLAQGFRLTEDDLLALGKQLKQTLGVGGRAGADEIELQGRHVEKVVEQLTAAGYRAQAC